MTDRACLYSLVFAPHERIEPLVHELVVPVARRVRHAPELDSLFFVRFSEPEWQLRFRILGAPAWIEGEVRPQMLERLAALKTAGAIRGFQFERYDREVERYGGEEGMRLAERLFTLDSLAVLDLMEAERDGEIAITRRELSMQLVERMLDLARFDEEKRVAFYRHGYAWALETWKEEDLRALESRFEALRPALDQRFAPAAAEDAARWGGPRPAAIAARWVEEARPVFEELLAGLAAGRVHQEPVYLVWSYAHMFTNRLGIESAGEAVLRFFMHRLLEERAQRPV